MKIGVAYNEGQVAGNLGTCRTFLLITTEGKTPTGKQLIQIPDTGTTGMVKTVSMTGLDVLICGALGFAVRNALELAGVLLVPGCAGSAEEAVAKFLAGEKQGDPSLLEMGREEDLDDPMSCMHDCARCAGCGPLELLRQLPDRPE